MLRLKKTKCRDGVMTTSSGILQSYLDTLSSDTLLELDDNALFLHNKSKQGGDFSAALNDYLKVIEDYSGDMISYELMLPYMSEERKKQLIGDLQITKILLFAQTKYELLHQKKENQRKYADYIERCDELLVLLNQYKPLRFYHEIINNFDEALFPYLTEESKVQLQRNLNVAALLLLSETQYDGEKKRCEQLLDALQRDASKKSPAQDHLTKGNPFKYVWLSLGNVLSKYIAQWVDSSQTKVIIGAMSALNEKRLYWVWGGGLLSTVIDLLPADFFNVDNASKVARAPDPYTGFLSWGLYYFRFALNLGLLLKHTIKGPWMSKEESQTPMSERFLTQWNLRKFTLLNDSLWATANMVCFFWLNAQKALGVWGDLLTLVLLVFDASAAIWGFAEQEAQYLKEVEQFDLDIRRLTDEMVRVQMDAQLDEKNKLIRIQAYTLRLFALERSQTQCKNNWECQKLSAQTEIAYAVALVIAFALMTVPFLPITGAALMVISIGGTALCFALTVLYNAVKNDLKIYAAHLSSENALCALNKKIVAFQKPNLDVNEKKLLFLEIKQLEAETKYQKRMVDLQTMHFFRSLIIEVFFPPLIFASFIFLPLGPGFVILAVALALAVKSNSMIDSKFNPPKENLIAFAQEEYEQFCKDVGQRIKPSLCSGSFFFKSNKVVHEDSFDERLGSAGCVL